MSKKILTLLALIACSSTAFANDTLDLIDKKITLVNINEETSVKVMPDMFSSSVTFKYDNKESRDAQKKLNEKINFAIVDLKKAELEYSLGSAHTYKYGKEEKYVASQSITIKSSNRKALENITTKLQQQGGLVSNTVSYVSEKLRNEQFEILFKQAQEKATQKAEFLTKSLNKTNYEITNISYYMNDSVVRPLHTMEMMRTSAIKKDSSVSVDNSDKKITLRLDMSIALIKDKQ